LGTAFPSNVEYYCN